MPWKVDNFSKEVFLHLESEYYKQSIDRLSKSIYYVLSPKLGMYLELNNQIKHRGEDILNASPSLYFIEESLYCDCVMSIMKFVEGKKSDGSFERVLNRFKSNLKHIGLDFARLDINVIDESLSILEEVKIQINNLKVQRDKFFAHSDKEYFVGINKLRNDFPDSCYDMAKVIKALQRIISKHTFIINESWKVDISSFAQISMKLTIDTLIEKSKTQKNEK